METEFSTNRGCFLLFWFIELKNMRKKIIIALIIILILAIGGFFWWEKGGGEQLWIEEIEIKGSIRDFLIEETVEGKTIRNKRDGWSVRVPDQWEIKKSESVSFYEWGLEVYSPDFKMKANYLLEKGCAIGIAMEKSGLQFEATQIKISNIEDLGKAEGYFPGLKKDRIELIKIGLYKGIKELIYKDSERLTRIEARIPLRDDRNIYFNLNTTQKEEQICIQEFNKFLETALID